MRHTSRTVFKIVSWRYEKLCQAKSLNDLRHWCRVWRMECVIIIQSTAHSPNVFIDRQIGSRQPLSFTVVSLDSVRGIMTSIYYYYYYSLCEKSSTHIFFVFISCVFFFGFRWNWFLASDTQAHSTHKHPRRILHIRYLPRWRRHRRAHSHSWPIVLVSHAWKYPIRLQCRTLIVRRQHNWPKWEENESDAWWRRECETCKPSFYSNNNK